MSTPRRHPAPPDEPADRGGIPAIPRGDRLAPDLDWTAAHVRRRVVVVVAVMLGTAVLAVLSLFPVQALFEGGTAEILGLVAQAACMAGAIACVVVSVQLQIAAAPMLHGISGADRKRISRRMLGGPGPLDPEAEWRAARMAAFARVSHPFGLGVIGLLGFAALLSVVRIALQGELFGVVATTVLVLLTPALAWEQRRRIRYAESSRELGWSSGPRSKAARTTDTVGG
jgi:hypothetical protein